MLSHIANEVISEINGILKTGQRVEYIHDGSSKITADQQMIRNIFLNLISNAIKFSPENKSIRVRTAVSEKEALITVSDEGIGIPPDEQVHLFERFFRARNATNIQGTGLGLNIVVKYLETLGGSINFTSELNKGTTFFVTIPL